MAFSFVLLASSLMGVQYEVSPSGDKDFLSIQEAIDASSHGDRIVVWPGTYYENIYFDGKSVELVSALGSAETILDGSNNGPVVLFDGNEGAGSVLNGFTLRNGVGYSRTDPDTAVGGGVAILDADPTIKNNVITSNQARAGGGIAVLFGDPHITNNTIENNTATKEGAGIFVLLSNPTIKVNHIANNTVTATQGEGGGMFLGFVDDPVFTDNVVVGNSADRGSGVFVDYVSDHLYFDFNTVADNCSPNGGGGLEMQSDSPHINISLDHCILWHNRMLYCEYLYFINDFEKFNPYYYMWSSDTSEYNGGSNGNISQDPYFVNPPYDYSVPYWSPAYGMGPRSFYEEFHGPQFIRGDADANGDVDYADVDTIWDWLCNGTPVQCVNALDANGDGFVDGSDPIYLIYHLNGYYDPPPLPFPDCGVDVSSGLSCDDHYCQ
jgi:parallel beta-helix repeat protein